MALARLAGTSLWLHTSSLQAKAKKSSTAGHTPSQGGHGRASERRAPGRKRSQASSSARQVCSCPVASARPGSGRGRRGDGAAPLRTHAGRPWDRTAPRPVRRCRVSCRARRDRARDRAGRAAARPRARADGADERRGARARPRERHARRARARRSRTGTPGRPGRSRRRHRPAARAPRSGCLRTASRRPGGARVRAVQPAPR